MPPFSAPPSDEPLANGAGKPVRAASPQHVLATQLSRLAEFSIWCQYGWVLLGGLVAGFLYGKAPSWYVHGFLVLDLAGVAVLALLVNRFRKARPRPEECAGWSRLFTLALLILGSTWGAAGVFLFVPDSLVDEAVLATAVIAMTAMSAASISWYLPAFLAFVIAALGPMSLRYMMGGNTLQLAIGAMALAYLFLLISLGWLLNRRLAGFIARQIENERQIEHLLTGRASENAVQARLETALESMSEGLAVFDAEDRLVICNHRFFGEQQAGGAPDITGLTFEELVRRDIVKKSEERHIEGSGIVNATGREDAYIEERLAYHRRLTGTFEVERSDGRWFQIRDRRTADGGTVVVQTEITSHKRAEEILRAAKDRAEWASRTKSEFLANTSHELRTPLNAIIGFSEVMATEMFGELGNPRYREYVRNIHESGEHLLAVVNDLLDLSKIEAGKMELHDELVDVSDAVTSAWTMARKARDGHTPRFATVIPDALPQLRADKRMFQQILLNFLSNAVKFTPADGRIEIIGKTGDGGGLIIEITDTGIGMTAEELERAFEAFGQGNGALTRSHEGTGLGVPLAKSLIELHKGTLGITSKPGVGTKVIIRFPQERVEQRQKKSA